MHWTSGAVWSGVINPNSNHPVQSSVVFRLTVKIFTCPKWNNINSRITEISGETPPKAVEISYQNSIISTESHFTR